MDEFEFSEDEIRKELENLGYFNVHQSRLTEFKRDLQNLVDVDRSNTASNTSTNVPSSESNYDLSSSDRDGPQFRVQPILRKPLDGSESRHNVVQSTTQLQANPVGKENMVSATTSQQVITSRTHPRDAIHIPSDSQTRGDISVPFNSGYRESSVLRPHQHSYPASGVPHVMTEGHNVSMDTTASTASDRSIMKRKVLRKVDGHSQIFDESSVTDTDDYTTDSIEERLQNMRLHIPDTGYISQNGTRRPQTAVLEHKPEMEPRHHVNRPHSAHAAYRLPKYYDGPKALIKPMTSQPHTKNIKKTDPVSKYQQYRESWQSQRAPGEKKHKALRWHVREHMLYHDEVVKKKAHNVYVSNDYVVPSDKKRKNLRWQIRMDLAQGVIPPSQFD